MAKFCVCFLLLGTSEGSKVEVFGELETETSPTLYFFPLLYFY